MLDQINDATNVLNVRIKGSLNSILKSRLFVYPEPDTTYQQDLYNEKLENDTYTAEDFHEQIFQSPGLVRHICFCGVIFFIFATTDDDR